VLEGLWLKTKIRSGARCTISGRRFCRQLWHGRGLRAGDGLPVWHQLERIFSLRAVLPARC
jgi:hypothetical protein